MGVTASSSCTTNVSTVEEIPLQLSEKERKLIQQSWSLSERQGYENCGQRIFKKIFSLNPEIKPVFSFEEPSSTSAEGVGTGEPYTKAFYKHVRAFMNMLELAVSKSSHLQELRAVCQELGRRHAHFGLKGFKPEYWNTFEQAIVECAIEWEENSNPRTLDSWAKLVKFIIWYMRAGFEQETAKIAAGGSDKDKDKEDNQPNEAMKTNS